MKRKQSFLRSLLVLLILGMGCLPIPVMAQEGGITEDFESYELPGWERSPDAMVVDGVLRVNPGNFAFKVGEWHDYRLEIRVRTEGPGEVVIHYYFRDESRYSLHLLPEEILLERAIGDSGEIIGSSGIEAIRTGSWIDVAIRVVGSEHQISIEDEILIQATDPEPLMAGAIGLMFHGEGYAEFDDLKINFEPFAVEGEGEEHRNGMEGAASEGDIPAAEATPTTGDQQGSAASWLEEFLSGQAQPIELQTFVINLLLAAFLAFVLGRIYIYWGSSLSNRRKFASNFMLITITTTFIILVVRSSVALSLGLVGALSIVRFRAAIKEPEELAYLFFAIGIGIGLGDNQRLITLLAMAAGVMIIGLMRLFHNREADVNLQISVASENPGEVNLESIMGVMDPYCSKLKLLRFDESDSALEASFLVELRALEKLQEARKALRALSPSIEITFLDNRGLG